VLLLVASGLFIFGVYALREARWRNGHGTLLFMIVVDRWQMRPPINHDHETDGQTTAATGRRPRPSRTT
jgi:hypothetical protein